MLETVDQQSNIIKILVKMGDCNSKCSFCEGRNAKDHSNSSCRNPCTCTCKCCVGNGHDIAQKTSAITAGVGLTGLGIALCLFSGGLAAPFVGAAIAGTGVSSAANGITKAAKGEKMDAQDFVVDTAIGAASGALTAGGAVTGNLMKKAAQEGVKMTIKETTKHIAFKTTVMGATGCAQAAMSEGANWAWKPLEKEKEEQGETRKFNPHCLWIGAAVGAVGAAGSSLSKGAANKAADQLANKASVLTSRGVVKCTTRVAGESVTGTVKGTINAAGKLAKSNDPNARFDGHELWAGAATGAVSSACRDATNKLIKVVAPKSGAQNPTTRNNTNVKSGGLKRNVIRSGSAFVETAATEGIQEAKQKASGDDETRHFGKSFCIGLFESVNENLGRYSEKYSTRASQRRQSLVERSPSNNEDEHEAV